MKKNKDQDIFKEAIKRKIADEPLSSGVDDQLWERVLLDISEEKKIVEAKNYFVWYATAAAILICLSVTLGLYLFKNNSTIASVNKPAQELVKENSQGVKQTDGQPEDIKAQQENRVNGKAENLSNVSVTSSAPDFQNAIVIEAGKGTSVKELPDRSLVALNRTSSVRVVKNFKNERNLQLEGEAYFEVQSDKTKPFCVYFDEYKLVVVGTKFNVRNLIDESIKEVSVTEGIVRVFDNKNNEGIEVKQGEQLKLAKDKEPELIKVDAIHFISWKTGDLNFKNTPLEEVVTILGRSFDEKIILESHIKNCKFTGDLSDLNFEEALQVVGMTTSFKIERTQNKVIISGSSCD